MICAGLGSTSNTTRKAVLAALDAALAHHRLARADLTALATVPRKKDEAGFHETASQLDLPLIVASEEALEAAAGRCLTVSPASLHATGVGSASEAAALAACGATARLLGPRLVREGVTCAIATTGNQP
ncbi:cobalamin biosynthesis protein [Nitratireductor luteus]|uniref:cobalamin biosynthesis protein n=1 Tax=Nitratireductor luteus TaxID=2976980 RepID=UPI00223FA94F|nr:cobalamin biosynthesis protein [Nitratireductor luteus]